MLNVARLGMGGVQLSRAIQPSRIAGFSSFSSTAGNSIGPSPNILDRNKVIASVALWSLLGACQLGYEGAAGGAIVGLGYGATVTGLTRFVKGPGASAPFWIWGPTLLATLTIGSSLDEKTSNINSENKTKIFVEKKQINVDRRVSVWINGQEVDNPELAEKIAKDSLSLKRSVLKRVGSALQEIADAIKSESDQGK